MTRGVGAPTAPTLGGAERILWFQGLVGVVCLATLALIRAFRERTELERTIGELERQIGKRVPDSEEVIAGGRVSEERYHLLVEGVKDYAIFLLDVDGRVASWNSGAKRIKGYTAEEIIGRHFSVFYPAADTAARKPEQGLRVAVAEGRFEEEGWRVRKDGSEFWANVLITPLREPDGRLAGFAKVTRDLTASRAAELALRQSERRVLAMFDETVQFIGLMSPDGILLQANRTALAAAGVSAADVCGKPFWETVWWNHDPVQQERLRDAVRRAAAGETVRFEASHPRPDGGLIWVDFSLKPVRDEAGTVTFLIPEGRDVSEQKKVQQALSASEALLREFVRHAPAAIAMLDVDLRFLMVSDRWLTDYHLEGRELRGCSYFDVFPEARERWREILQRVLAGSVEQCVDDRFDQADGSVEWLQWEARPWRGSGGEVAGLIFFRQTITGRKRMEEALRISEERLRLALENARHGLWDWGVRDGSLFLDETWAVVHGYSPGELPITYEWWAESIHPEDKERVFKALNLHLASDDALYDVSYRARRKDGSWVWLNTRGRVQTRDENGRAVRMMGTIHDVSEQKRAEEDLLRSVREKEVMLREIHHRVKNNLAVISSLFHLQASSAADGATQQALREAQDRVRSMALVHEHLYHSADLSAVAFQDYAGTLTRQIFNTYRLPSADVALQIEVEPVRLTVEQAIPSGLILNELLTNCLKHAFESHRRGVVRVELAEREGNCVLRVTDDGGGLPGGFDVQSTRTLGVRLIRSLTRQLDGTVEYLSADPGTEVRLTFPMNARREEALPQAAS